MFLKAIGIFRDTFSSLKIRNFRLFFIGQTISASGTFMQGVAQAWLVLKVTNSGTALGVVTALQFLPILLFGPWGGIIADRFSKRNILYVTQSLSGLLAFILGALVLTGNVELWEVYLMALLLGFINVIDNPSRQTFIAEMVGEGELKNAITLNSVLMNLSRVIGPTIAGVIIATSGLAACFVLNGISFFAVVMVLYLMHQDELFQFKHRENIEKGFLNGFFYIMSKPILRTTLVMMAIIGTFSYEFQVSLPLLSEKAFHGGAEGFAALIAAMGVGSVIGGILTASSKKVNPNVLILSALIFGFSILAVAAMPSLVLSIYAMVAVGISSIYFVSLGNTIMQLGSAPELRGRVMAFWSMAFVGSTAIGGPIVGWIGQHIGSRWGLVIGGFSAIFAACLGFVMLEKEHLSFNMTKDSNGK